MRAVSNPFVISGYEGEKYFCDTSMTCFYGIGLRSRDD